MGLSVPRSTQVLSLGPRYLSDVTAGCSQPHRGTQIHRRFVADEVSQRHFLDRLRHAGAHAQRHVPEPLVRARTVVVPVARRDGNRTPTSRRPASTAVLLQWPLRRCFGRDAQISGQPRKHNLAATIVEQLSSTHTYSDTCREWTDSWDRPKESPGDPEDLAGLACLRPAAYGGGQPGPAAGLGLR